MGQKRKEEDPDDGCPICSHAKTKVWFRSSNVQTQTFNSPRGSHCSEEESAYDTGVYHCPSSKRHDPAPATRCDGTGFEDEEPRPGFNRNPNKCQRCDSSLPRSSVTPEKKIYLHLNLRNRESPQLVICPKRNHRPHSGSSSAASRDTVIDVDSLSLPLPSRPWSRMSEPAALSMASRPRTAGDSHHDLQLQSLRQAYGSSCKPVAMEQRVPSPGSAANQRQKPQMYNAAALPQAIRCSRPPQRRPPSIARDDERLLLLPKWPHGQQQQQQIASVGSQSSPRGDRAGSSSILATMVSPTAKVTKDQPLRVKGGSGTPEEGPGDSSSTAEGVVLSWENLTVTSKVGKVLLDNLNGQIISGFTAIMGPSGSGKSTLLNTLACRMGQSASIAGRILLNGREYKIADLKKMSGYVMQDDLLNAHLTVEETLKYTTRLKLEPSLTEEEVCSRVDEIIKQMGLDHVRNTVIGSPEKRGISGGERKRVCVGMELLTHPQLLFLDEPTSGLDSVTALSLCEQLQKLAATGSSCTIVCTIHQPQAKIFNLFHCLIILKAGQVIYQGKASEVLRFFEDSGFPCPEYTNPADHLLDVITPSINRPRDSLKNVDDALKSKFHPLPVNMSQGSEYLVLQTTRERMPWHRQYIVLLNRGVREQIRKKNVLITQMCQSVLVALLIGGVFFQIGDTQTSTVRRQPVLFFCVINQGVFGALTVINSFPGERALTLRERAAGMYYCSAYFMAKVTAEMVSQIVSPMIFSCIVYWMVGFQRKGSKFMIFMTFMILTQLAATSLALMISAICRTTDLSVTVLPMALEVNRLFGGFFLSPRSLPKYFAWLDALSYVKYTYTAISLNELRHLTIRCTAKQYVNGVCPITTGEQTIATLGLDYLNIGSCATILIFYILITRVVAYLGIRFLKK